MRGIVCFASEMQKSFSKLVQDLKQQLAKVTLKTAALTSKCIGYQLFPYSYIHYNQT
jgi:hypothetical protein